MFGWFYFSHFCNNLSLLKLSFLAVLGVSVERKLPLGKKKQMKKQTNRERTIITISRPVIHIAYFEESEKTNIKGVTTILHMFV